MLGQEHKAVTVRLLQCWVFMLLQEHLHHFGHQDFTLVQLRVLLGITFFGVGHDHLGFLCCHLAERGALLGHHGEDLLDAIEEGGVLVTVSH